MSDTLDLPTRFRAGPRVAARTPTDWKDLAYTRFGVEPASPTIGAFISGVRLSEPIDDELYTELHRALLEWKVLFFRDQHLTPEQHRAVGERWGELEHHPFFIFGSGQDETRPEVARFEKNADAKGVENVWHSDVSWRINPSLGSLLHAIEIPAVGGDTLWADMAAAYDNLDEDLKKRIEGLTAVHDWWDTFGRHMPDDQREALRPAFPPAEHPVVRTHPETGRKTLYVNAIFTQHIVGMDPQESQELLALLCHQAEYPEYQCRLRWEPGTLAFWDNRATQHYASSDYYPQRRVMERLTVMGDRPF